MRDHSRKKIDNREEVRELKRTVRMSIVKRSAKLGS